MPKRFENGYFALALICAVCLFALALLSWSIPYSKGYQRADQDHQSAYATQQTAEEHERKCRTELTIEKALSCYRDAYNTDREQERAEKDLDAQREMANWAEGMLWATVTIGSITAGVTALGVWYVAKTLSATSATLAAANETNRIMRDEQRPWVTLIREAEVNFIDQLHQGVLSWNINLRNKGKTPAHSVRIQEKIIKASSHVFSRNALEEYVQECIRGHRGSADIPIIFADESTEFLRYDSFRGHTYEVSSEGKQFPSGERFTIFVCITYRTGLVEDSPIGVEAATFSIQQRRNEWNKEPICGPWHSIMLEWAQSRIVR